MCVLCIFVLIRAWGKELCVCSLMHLLKYYKGFVWKHFHKFGCVDHNKQWFGSHSHIHACMGCVFQKHHKPELIVTMGVRCFWETQPWSPALIRTSSCPPTIHFRGHLHEFVVFSSVETLSKPWVSDKPASQCSSWWQELIAATRHKVFSEHWSSEMTSQDGVVPAVPVLIRRCYSIQHKAIMWLKDAWTLCTSQM